MRYPLRLRSLEPHHRSSAYRSQMFMKSCTTMLGIRSYSVTFDFPPPIFTGHFLRMFSMDGSSNLLPSLVHLWMSLMPPMLFLCHRRLSGLILDSLCSYSRDHLGGIKDLDLA